MCTTTQNHLLQEPPPSISVNAHRGGAEVVDTLADEWRELCANSGADNPFCRPEWIGAHIRAFSPNAKVLVITARSNGRLCLVLPLLEEQSTFCKVPVRRLRTPVNVHCGRFDAVRSSGPEGDVAIDATWNYLQKIRRWDVLQLDYAPDESTISRLVALASAHQFHTTIVPDRPSPYIPVPCEPALLQRMPPNAKLRSQLRQVYKRLEDKAPLRLVRTDASDPQALDVFYRLEASGWKRKEGTAILCDPVKRQFFDDIARSASALGYFALYVLKWNNQPLAAHFSLVLQGKCYSPKVAYEETFKQFAAGHLIVNEILKDCSAHGIGVLDIMGEDEAWKMKWTDHASPVNHYMVFAGPRGNLAYALGRKIKPAMGRLLQRGHKSA